MNPLRKAIRAFGLDLHRYSHTPSKISYLRLLNIQTVLDIGANTGQFAREIRRVLPNTQIYSFEPLKDCFEQIKQNFKNDHNFKAFNFAIGEVDGETTIHKSAYAPSSSILKMAEVHKTLFPHTKEHTEEKIKVKRLDDLAANLDLKKEILIKVDVQGFEDKVLAGGTETFNKARAVIMEVSFVTLYEGEPTFDSLYQKLEGLGFEYSGSLEQKLDKITSQIISEDSLFLKLKPLE